MEIANNYELLISDFPKPNKPVKQSKPLVFRLIQLAFQAFGPLFPSRAAQYAFRLFTTPRINAKHKISDPILEKAKIFEFLYGKYLLKGYEWGSGDRIVLLVHGWRSRGTALRSFVPGLLEKGYKVVAFDAPAHGDSPGKRTTLPQFSGAVRAVLNHLGGVEGVITHSFGGASTIFALQEGTEDFSIQKVVLIATPSSLENMADSFMASIHAPMAVIRRFYKIMENRIGIPLRQAHVSKFYPMINIGNALLVYDKKDEVVPFSEAQAILKRWPNTRLLATDGYGHYKLMKNPDVVKRVVDFF